MTTSTLEAMISIEAPAAPAMTGSGSARLREAEALARLHRARGWAALNDVFRDGTPREPPRNGAYRGGLAALDIAPGLTWLVNSLVGAWLPWKGKTFDPGARRGDNIFTNDSLGLARVFWPFYRDYRDDGPPKGRYRAFEFRTYTAPGLADPDRQVLKIDYDLGANPRLSIRRVLDELVQVAPGEYLGKAHLHWWWGSWQTVAFFTLRDAGR